MRRGARVAAEEDVAVGIETKGRRHLRKGPLGHRDRLEAPSQALTQSPLHGHRTGSGDHDPQGTVREPVRIPESLDHLRPSGNLLYLVQGQHKAAARAGPLPCTLPTLHQPARVPHGRREGIRGGCAASRSARDRRVRLVHRDVPKRQARSDQGLPNDGGLARLSRPENGGDPARRLHETADQRGDVVTLEPWYHRKLAYLFRFTQCRNFLYLHVTRTSTDERRRSGDRRHRLEVFRSGGPESGLGAFRRSGAGGDGERRDDVTAPERRPGRKRHPRTDFKIVKS